MRKSFRKIRNTAVIPEVKAAEENEEETKK